MRMPTDGAGVFCPAWLPAMPRAAAGPGFLNQMFFGTLLPRWQV